MSKILELQRYLDAVGEEDAVYDFQLLIAMREGEFKNDRLVFEILDCYKELVNSNDSLDDWDYPEETEKYTVVQLIEHLSKE